MNKDKFYKYTKLSIEIFVVLFFVYFFMTPESTENNLSKNKIKLFYYNIEADKKLSGGNINCLEEAVLPVERELVFSKNKIEDTINLLLDGKITEEERISGFQTEFPNKDFKLIETKFNNGILKIKFTEVPGFSSGGSCRVGILSSQIKKTALQFEEVKEIMFEPKSIFQP